MVKHVSKGGRVNTQTTVNGKVYTNTKTYTIVQPWDSVNSSYTGCPVSLQPDSKIRLHNKPLYTKPNNFLVCRLNCCFIIMEGTIIHNTHLPPLLPLHTVSLVAPFSHTCESHPSLPSSLSLSPYQLVPFLLLLPHQLTVLPLISSFIINLDEPFLPLVSSRDKRINGSQLLQVKHWLLISPKRFSLHTNLYTNVWKSIRFMCAVVWRTLYSISA